MFLIDGSDSIMISDFEKVKEWMTELITLLEGAKLEHVANIVVAQFSTNARTELTAPITDHIGNVQKINSMVQMARGTNLYAGLAHVNEEVASR